MHYSRLILVDSTRSGKRIPDALSKTIPIWCAVVNRAIRLRYPETPSSWDSSLYTPPQSVSVQEHHLIEQRLDGWAKELMNSTFSLPQLAYPLRPFWITPSTSVLPSLRIFEDMSHSPVICVSASKQIDEAFERRSSGFSYVQGSGDDHELWGLGLTPDAFWRNRGRLLAATRTELPDLIASVLVSSTEGGGARCQPTPVAKVDGQILICASDDIMKQNDLDTSSDSLAVANLAYVIITTGDDSGEQATPPSNPSSKTLRFKIPEGKKGQARFLRKVLPESLPFIAAHLRKGNRVCISCPSGKDTSVGLALVGLQLFFDGDGQFVSQGRPSSIATKQSIRQRLEWIISSRPEANPSRSTLQRVNEFILSGSPSTEAITRD
ncbi:hypothetical protein HGRIS_001923 [Hohenbuehelia grisea]|uniref:Initiator tRNA phosphoribosyl transferase n=1 Tax=Hohenbuehelia grisea TaxID=104357 RepID=A0ABR3JK72_9AGAR